MSLCQIIMGLFWPKDTSLIRVENAALKLSKAYYKGGKSPKYYKKLQVFLQSMRELENDKKYKKLEEFTFASTITEDIRCIRNLKYLADRKFIPSLLKSANEAIKTGIPYEIINDTVADVVDLECQNAEGAKNKFNAYLEIKDRECAICLEKFEVADFVKKTVHRTACKHFFHEECFNRWSKECAVCRSVAKPSEIMRWKNYLDTIHTQVLNSFTASQIERAKKRVITKKPLEDDETIARRFQEELNREEEEDTQNLIAETIVFQRW